VLEKLPLSVLEDDHWPAEDEGHPGLEGAEFVEVPSQVFSERLQLGEEHDDAPHDGADERPDAGYDDRSH